MKGLGDKLHDVFFARLFAGFENGLRNLYVTSRRSNEPRTQVLIRVVASRHKIPSDVFEVAQEIREFRNSLVHDDAKPAKPYFIGDAERDLQLFLGRLPHTL